MLFAERSLFQVVCFGTEVDKVNGPTIAPELCVEPSSTTSTSNIWCLPVCGAQPWSALERISPRLQVGMTMLIRIEVPVIKRGATCQEAH